MISGNPPDKPVLTLFQLWFDTPQINPAARIITSRLIKDYTYEKVYEAFLEAATKGKDKLTLAYVRGILIKKAQQESVKKNIQEAKIKSQQSAVGSGQSGIGGFDFSSILKVPVPDTQKETEIKNSEAYKKAKQQFENEIKKGENNVR